MTSNRLWPHCACSLTNLPWGQSMHGNHRLWLLALKMESEAWNKGAINTFSFSLTPIRMQLLPSSEKQMIWALNI